MRAIRGATITIPALRIITDQLVPYTLAGSARYVIALRVVPKMLIPAAHHGMEWPPR